MVIVIPAISGKIGSTVYYETTMKVREFVRTVKPPVELKGWKQLSIEERLQRDPDYKRINTQLVPYIANNEDRFFGSVIVLIYDGEVEFDSLEEYVHNIPSAYRSCIHNMGFLTISGETFVVLDGQHRRIALEKICNDEDVHGEYSEDVANDDICVIFIEHVSTQKTRRIFNTVNRYAKQTSRGDNIITSEDDGYAIISRALLQENAPLGFPDGLVNWRSNTLPKRSTQLTTISVVYETVKLILDHHGVENLEQQIRLSDEKLQELQEHCTEVWSTMLTSIKPYELALKNPGRIPEFRHDESKESLLFKPAAQIALVDGLMRAMRFGEMSLIRTVKRVNRIKNWSMSNNDWSGVIIRSSGAIDASLEARKRMAKLVCFLLAADRISDKVKYGAWKTYNLANGIDIDVDEELLDLPHPAMGDRYTIKEGIEWHEKHKQS